MAQLTDPLGDPVTAAIERVLGAERDGVAGLRADRQRTKALIAAAREQAGMIARRAEACLSKLHAAYLQKIQRQIEQLDRAQSSAKDAARNQLDRELLHKAAQRLAAKLTGAP